MNLKRVAIVDHTGQQAARTLSGELNAWFQGREIEVTDTDPHLVISVGGDGTMLRAAQVAHAADAPLLGINTGRVGYLTEVDAGKELDALEAVFDGEFTIEDRMMLACDTDEGSYVALNEVLVERAARHRLVRLDVRVGGERLASFNGDGVIVATPTGSTAYALSAGGPIVSPKANCLVVVPVSPHMFFSRPVVLAADETVEVIVDPLGEDASLLIDGSIGHDLPPGAAITVRRHLRPLKLLRVGGPGFLERLRTKLDLPGQ
ncbi:MAG: NAD(+)/NADH kinase [Actinomycetota bacterium]